MVAPFRLLAWHLAHANARVAIAGSGMASPSIEPYLPANAREWDALWQAPADLQARAFEDEVAQAYGLAAHEVMVTQGASEADFLATLALGRGRVAVERPAYHALVEPARALGFAVERLPRRAPGFELSAGPRTRPHLTLLASPHNPTGARVPDEDLVALARGGHVLVDEVFAEATPGHRPAALLHERILSVNSLTKCYGFGSIQVGWVAGPRAAIEKMRRAKDLVRPGNPLPSLVVARRVLADRGRLVATTQARRAENARLVRSLPLEPLRGVVGEHGTTMALRLPPGTRDLPFATRLFEEEGVLVSPGSLIELPGWIRVSLLAPPAALKAGLAAAVRVASEQPKAGKRRPAQRRKR
ncbi:MAG: pyridoxal phosphate-dependent aminotransferase [Thermoplasmatota archaeon]